MECWKAIIGYEGFYEVSDIGNVRSVDRDIRKSDGVIQRRRGRACKKCEDKNGYYYVKLNREASTKYFRIHRLVYEAFVAHISDDCEIDHVDFDRKNNRVDNLRAISHAENVRHTCIAGRHAASDHAFAGKSNPNYGNRKLSEKYKLDPDMAREKQGRPGSKNGRARRTTLTFVDGEMMCFEYIRQAVDYLINNGIVRTSRETLAVNLSKAAKSGTPYKNIDVYIN